ncbi:dihydrodipicolinate synthase family protein [Rhodobacterales bacterium HKCCSP123]|nr:dihydrodipicolinate synthase family protein [Rhodobacterales bacterium HKCCSP123]
MTEASLKGVIAAIPTPFDAGGEPDTDRFVRLAKVLLDTGCDALNVCGTTGEATSMSVAQRSAVMRAAASELPRERLMVGTGAAAVSDAVELTRMAASLGFAGALVLPPFYYKGVSDAGIVDYLREIVKATEAAPVPIYLYNFPALSGVAYTPGLVAALIEAFPGRIRGIKDSSGDMAYAGEVAALRGGILDVFPSNEGTLKEAREGRFAGCISATANLTGRDCALAFRDGDAVALDRAVSIRKRLSTGDLIPNVKAATARMMKDPDYARVRPPLVALTGEEADELANGLSALEEAKS